VLSDIIIGRLAAKRPIVARSIALRESTPESAQLSNRLACVNTPVSATMKAPFPDEAAC